MVGYLYLACAIALELAGTSCLKYADGFTKWLPTVGTVVFYVAAFFFLSLSLRTLSLSAAYATWSGVGIAAAGLIAYLVFGEKLNFVGIIGILLIISGVVLVNLYGKAH